MRRNICKRNCYNQTLFILQTFQQTVQMKNWGRLLSLYLRINKVLKVKSNLSLKTLTTLNKKEVITKS